MISLRPLLVPLLAGTLVVPAFAAQRGARGEGGAGRARPESARRVEEPRPREGGNGANAQVRQPDNHPGEQVFDKMMHMTPDEREKALSKLGPARRAQIEQRIRNFEKLPPAAQTRRLDRLERLNSLPLQRQNQVRKSMRDLQDLPQERRMAVNRELQRMAPMSDEDRRSYMNTEEFRNRYSPQEQQMMSNLAAVE